MKHLSIMIKPASSVCNCVCSYCFYDDVSACRNVKSYGLMKSETRLAIIQRVFETDHLASVHFAFQGGEPTLIGLSFYEEFVSIVVQYAKNVSVTYGIQTNGTLLTEAWIAFFKAHNFLVGISIDGFEANHNRNRFIHRTGSFDHVMRGLMLLQNAEIEYNVLTVLTKSLAQHPHALWDFYLENHIDYIQIIECLPDFGQTVEESPFACTPTLYESFYSAFFNLWFDALKRGNYRSIGLFDDCIRIMNGHMPLTCGRYGGCGAQSVIEADGSVYPCDFHVMDEYRIGSLRSERFDTLYSPQMYFKFLSDRGMISPQCSQCPLMGIVCHGGCKRMRDTFVNDQQCSYRMILELFMTHRDDINNALSFSDKELM